MSHLQAGIQVVALCVIAAAQAIRVLFSARRP